MKRKSIAALGISLVLAASAGLAQAAVEPFYNPSTEDWPWTNENNCDGAEFYGYRYPIGYTLFYVPSMTDGYSVAVNGYDYSNNFIGTGYFSCIKGTLYYDDGPFFEFGDWYNAP